MGLAIECVGLEKTFVKKRSIRELALHPFRRADRIPALRGVDLRIREGEIFSLLGPNGAGKTTLLKILACLILPDSGSAMVGGLDTLQESRVKSQLGLVHTDERSFYWRLTARENLRFFARLYDLDGARVNSRIDELLERVDMTESADRPFSDYSSGMKQRIAIARALLHDPPILLMDEPTRSLDPGASMSLRKFVLEELSRRDRKTIVLATHNLHEAEALAHTVAILVGGKVREVGSVDQVRRWGMEDRRYDLELDAGSAALEGPFRVLTDETKNGTRHVEIVLAADADFEDLMRALLATGVGIRACGRVEPNLEHAFARIIDSDGEQT